MKPDYQKIQKIVILGAGESGTGAALLAKQKGFQVFLSDFGIIKEPYQAILEENCIEFEQNQHSERKILSADLVIKSPGIDPKTSLVQLIKKHSIPIVSEPEFAIHFTDAKIIAVTGSAGKTTTTSMIFQILKHANFDVALCGNIGISVASTVAQKNYQWLVMELSSFQLEDIFDLHPHIAVITNLTENHLNRYDYLLEKYANAKFQLIKNMTENDFLVYNLDPELLCQELSKHQFRCQMLGFSYNEKPESIGWINSKKSHKSIFINMSKNKKKNDLPFDVPIEELKAKGKHNEYNSLASSIVGNLLEIRNESIRESLENFQNIEHRLEPVAIVKGVTYINDSKATSVNSTWFALESMTSPVIWIVGGVDKGNDYGQLLELVSSKVKGIVTLGKDIFKIVDAFENVVPLMKHAYSMEEAVQLAAQLASENDCVLLSPACASFDMFENFEQRGKKFKEAVNNLF